MIEFQKTQISKAKHTDYRTLTEIAFLSKRHWHYPENYYQIWKDELTISKEYIKNNIVFKLQLENLILGFYSIVENKSDFYSGNVFVKKGFWLEHIFIKPDYHKLGAGKLLIKHAKMISEKLKISNLFIFVDPYAQGFYDKIGAKFLYESESSIPNRLIPVYELRID